MSASLALVAGMTAALYTLAPTGFYRFCADQPTACAPRGGDVVPTVPMLDGVNRRVNAAIRPKAEAPGRDVWRIGGNSGDCEDYALTKRAALLKAGVASSRLRLAVGTLANGEGHAVLVVATCCGELVLDNRTDRLLPPSAARIRWRSIQSPDDPRMWLRAGE